MEFKPAMVTLSNWISNVHWSQDDNGIHVFGGDMALLEFIANPGHRLSLGFTFPVVTFIIWISGPEWSQSFDGFHARIGDTREMEFKNPMVTQPRCKLPDMPRKSLQP